MSLLRPCGEESMLGCRSAGVDPSMRPSNGATTMCPADSVLSCRYQVECLIPERCSPGIRKRLDGSDELVTHSGHSEPAREPCTGLLLEHSTLQCATGSDAVDDFLAGVGPFLSSLQLTDWCPGLKPLLCLPPPRLARTLFTFCVSSW